MWHPSYGVQVFAAAFCAEICIMDTGSGIGVADQIMPAAPDPLSPGAVGGLSTNTNRAKCVTRRRRLSQEVIRGRVGVTSHCNSLHFSVVSQRLYHFAQLKSTLTYPLDYTYMRDL